MSSQQPGPRSAESAPASTPGKGSGGVLPVSAAALKKSTVNSGSARSSNRAPAPRLKLILRRLPPGLTEDEFIAALGPEWQVGAGKVDWVAYKSGKVSRDPAKPSRPARAYLKVKDQPLITLLSERVKETSFQDVKNSVNDPCLMGPPSLEFAPYNRVPGGRVRKDGRQGTIDQDPEFIAFLHSLTEPITKPTANGDATETRTEAEKNTITPLIQYIKEKKANKAKEKAEKAAEKSAKSQKGKQSKEDKGAKGEVKKVSVMKKDKSETKATGEQGQVEKATKDAAKAANKQAAAMKGKDSAGKTSDPAAQKDVGSTTPKAERERRPARSALQTLQRDLAQAASPRSERRSKAAKDSASKASESSAKIATTPSQPAAAKASQSPSPAPTANAKAATNTPSGVKGGKQASGQSQQQTAAKSSKLFPVPAAGAKAAFLKHANPSQGVTEPLLVAEFSKFGKVIKCEIDKRKGFGYIDFEEPESLKTAMAASPVKVGDKGGSVVVLEKRGGPGSGSTKGGGSTPAKSGQARDASPAPSTPTSSVQAVHAPSETASNASLAPKDNSAPTTPSLTASTPTSSATAASATKTANAGARGGQGKGGGRGGSGRGGRTGGNRGRGNRGGSNTGNAGNASTQSTAVPAGDKK